MEQHEKELHEEQAKNPKGASKLSIFKASANKAIVSNNMKVTHLEDAFKIKHTRRNSTATSHKNEDKADIQKYRAHLRMLNLKVNPVARDFVVHEHEWRALMNVSLEQEKKSGRPIKMVVAEFEKDPMKVVANFISTRLCIRSTFDTIENERQRVLVLPQIQGLRDSAVADMMMDYASRRLQRIFRGFQGRAQMKRMVFRFNQKEEQHEMLNVRRKKMAERRQYRAWCACVVQARFKGILWRRRLAKMLYATVRIQTIWRGYSVRQKIKEEERKKLEGAKVRARAKRVQAKEVVGARASFVGVGRWRAARAKRVQARKVGCWRAERRLFACLLASVVGARTSFVGVFVGVFVASVVVAPQSLVLFALALLAAHR
jgi:hypothetical protein